MLGKVGMATKKTQIQMSNIAGKKQIRYGSGYPITHITKLTGHLHSVHPIGPQLLQSIYEL